MKTVNPQKYSIDGTRLGANKRAKTRSTLFGNQPGVNQEGHEFVPGEIMGGRREVGEVQSEAPSNEACRGNVAKRHEEGP